MSPSKTLMDISCFLILSTKIALFPTREQWPREATGPRAPSPGSTFGGTSALSQQVVPHQGLALCWKQELIGEVT